MITRGSTLIGCISNPLYSTLAQGFRFMSIQAFTIPARFNLTLLIDLSSPIQF
jgi:hypothetical protein